MKRKFSFKRLLPTLAMAFIYPCIELIWRNKTDVSMMLVGGLCGGAIDLLNETRKKCSILNQAIIGTIITTIIELVSGIVINLWLGMNVWDYSKMPFNILGQVCLLYSLFWFLLMPLAIWLGDYLRWLFYRDRRKYKFWTNYKLLYKDIFKLIRKVVSL